MFCPGSLFLQTRLLRKQKEGKYRKQFEMNIQNPISLQTELFSCICTKSNDSARLISEDSFNGIHDRDKTNQGN